MELIFLCNFISFQFPNFKENQLLNGSIEFVVESVTRIQKKLIKSKNKAVFFLFRMSGSGQNQEKIKAASISHFNARLTLFFFKFPIPFLF